MRTRVKICGITRLEDALAACAAGADALGFVFYDPSPRNIEFAEAAKIIRKLPTFVSTVGLFVDAEAEKIEKALEQVPLNTLQFHGEESPAFCQSFGHPYIKAIRTKDEATVVRALADYQQASALLFDTYVPGVAGGTGEKFDWQLFPKSSHSQVCILAGGLTPQNVVQAIEQTQPYAVDVSGGVEQSKGIKDPQLIQEFISGVNSVEL